MVRQGDKVAQMTLELHLNPLVQPVSELQATVKQAQAQGIIGSLWNHDVI